MAHAAASSPSVQKPSPQVGVAASAHSSTLGKPRSHRASTAWCAYMTLSSASSGSSTATTVHEPALA